MKERRFEVTAVEAGSPLAQEAQAIEDAVFEEKFGNEPGLYSKYNPSSTFLVVMDHEKGKACGMMRLVHDSPVGQPSLTDIEAPDQPWKQPVSEVLARSHLDLKPATTLDVASFAIPPEYRAENNPDSAWTRWALFYALCRYSDKAGAEAWVTILDDKVMQMIQENTGAPFENYPGIESAPYMGSKASTPVFSRYKEFRQRLETQEPDTFAFYFDLDNLPEIAAGEALQ